MGRVLRAVFLLVIGSGLGAAQKPATSPANEPRKVDTVRSAASIGADLKVPLCPVQFHDSLLGNGIAGQGEKGVTRAKVKSTVPAAITPQAINSAGKTHLGNFNVILDVIVDAKGLPSEICLKKSSGYGLDASAAAALSQYRFEPAKKDGKSVKMRLPVEIRFVTPNPPPMGAPGPSGDAQ